MTNTQKTKLIAYGSSLLKHIEQKIFCSQQSCKKYASNSCIYHQSINVIELKNQIFSKPHNKIKSNVSFDRGAKLFYMSTNLQYSGHTHLVSINRIRIIVLYKNLIQISQFVELFYLKISIYGNLSNYESSWLFVAKLLIENHLYIDKLTHTVDKHTLHSKPTFISLHVRVKLNFNQRQRLICRTLSLSL